MRNKLKFKLFFTTVSEFILSLIHKSFRQVLRTGSNKWLKRCDSIIISSQIGLISQIIKQYWVNVHFNFSLSYHVTSEEFKYRAWVIWTTLMSFCSFCTLKPPVLIQCAWKTATLLYQNAFFVYHRREKSNIKSTLRVSKWWQNWHDTWLENIGKPFLLLITISFAFCPAVILLNTSFTM